ncbi:MAG: hypothetical protein JRG79_10740 [Deltaproteobacteria bacterium]|nr:hypothetical protein [Deltaproteobacteria bacterium]MBW2207375.1 hypothetical protein [Deltaproteobacteria bacterium]
MGGSITHRRYHRENRFGQGPLNEYYSVELALEGLHYLHQFRIWSIHNGSMCVLVKESSEVLGSLRVGDVMRMKYYTMDSLCPTRDLHTEIKHITKEDQGKFKGHYVVGLSILEGQAREAMH